MLDFMTYGTSIPKRRFSTLKTVLGLARTALQLVTVVLPWPLRRIVLVRFFGYTLDATSRIGFAWVFPTRLVMGPHSLIDHLTVCRNTDLIELKECAVIGRLNWIYGYTGDQAYQSDVERRSELVLERHSAITNRHIVDCTNRIHVGAFATVAGYRSQLLTHSINFALGRQASKPIEIGEYCFVGTGCVLLGGSVVPDHSVLGAASLLNKAYSAPYTLYGGVPAQPIGPISPDYAYFSRRQGFVE